MKKKAQNKRAIKKNKSEKKMRSAGDFTGVMTALVTPFKKGHIDYVSLKRLVRQQLDGGIQGLVVNGTTAESPTLTQQEVGEIFKFVRKETDKSIPLVMGTGSNCTSSTIEKTILAGKLGADAALVVVPYYNKPPQRGIVAHYSAVAKASMIPVIMYNVPGRTVVSMTNETILELMKVRNIVGIKEASGDVARVPELCRSAPDAFLMTSGDDATCIDFMVNGGRGVISVVSHVIPNELVTITKRAMNAEVAAQKDYNKFKNLNRLLGIESNPIPVKMMLYLMGIINSPELRLPLVELTEQNKILVKNELETLGLLK